MNVFLRFRSLVLMVPVAAPLLIALAGCGESAPAPANSDANPSKAAESSYEAEIAKEKAAKGALGKTAK